MNQTKTIVLQGDCCNIIPTLGQFDFIFADPPFNINHKYIEYNDNRDDFSAFTANWIIACWKACDGILALHGSDALIEIYLNIAKQLGMHRIAWINWHYRFGQCVRTNWIDSRCHCLVYAKPKPWTWNPNAILVESDRVKYGDKRIHQTKHGGKRVPGTVWGIPSDGPYWGRVQGNNKERRKGHPNQLPEVYLKRLLLAYTNAGDRVLDPFSGSGTTAAVASALNRSCVAIDISNTCCESTKQRIIDGAIRV